MGKTPTNESHAYDTKQTDAEVPVILEIRGMRSIHPLPSHPGPLWPGEVAPDRVPSMDQIELNYVLQDCIAWN